MRKFNHYTILKIVAYGYIAFNILGLLGLMFHLVNGAEADFGMF